MAPENIVVLSPYKYTSEHLMIKDLVEKEGLLAPLNKDYSGDKVRIGTIQSFKVIGQVRKDTALFCVPDKIRKRGRPKKYGEKYTPKVVEDLPQTWIKLFIYGKLRWVRYRSVMAQARFLNGRLVHAVWSAIEDDDGKMPQDRLMLATDLSLSTTDVIVAYARRWPIENMFHQTKNSWGWKET